jgi:chromosomal replication initiator protein
LIASIQDCLLTSSILISLPSIVWVALKIDHKKLLLAVNDYFNLKMADITGPRRQKELVVPRQIAMYLMQTECNMPFEKIGQVLGGRDHTTVMHGVEKIKMAITRDREIQRLVLEIKQNLVG